MTTQPKLTADHFPGYFEALHKHPPFRWQSQLAGRVCNGHWPDFIKLPTSSGKTACIDIAVFALAVQAARHHETGQLITASRRVFFVVDRRVIVNEAFQRATDICTKLEAAVDDEISPLHPVAFWLRSLANHDQAPPLDCFELRGGIYRDDAWVRSMLQPTILTSTVDQIGSRLMFRGYGVSDRNLAIHAALTANDSLVILDEAHCSKPFSQTLGAIAAYRDARLAVVESARWSEEPIGTPFIVTQMTATPDPSTSAESIFELSDEDYKADQLLEDRHACPKPVKLLACSAKGKFQNKQLAKMLAAEALQLAFSPKETDVKPCTRIAVIVNRVACAMETYALLREKHGNRVYLMIGRMRPVDRDKLTAQLQETFQSSLDREADDLKEPHFVVATQCLEVGADFDFDGLVSQCASLDALRQRYGRLNRLGKAPHSRGVIVMADGDVKPKNPDPIYGDALPGTWEWLNAHAGSIDEQPFVDLGIRAMDALVAAHSGKETLSAESPNAPVLLPAHLDILCQTSPRPAVEPDIGMFLHGPNRGQAEVRVCWRADLPEQKDELHADDKWAAEVRETVAVCPPSASEVLSVPLSRFRNWLTGDDSEDNTGDMLSEQVEVFDVQQNNAANVVRERRGIVWTGQTDRNVYVSAKTVRAIRPNDTIVLPVTAGGWSQFGHIPDAPTDIAAEEHIDQDRRRELASIDIASQAFRQSRNRTIVRIHPGLISSSAVAACLRAMLPWINPDTAGTPAEILNAAEQDETGGDIKKTEGENCSLVAQDLKTIRSHCKQKGKKSVQFVRYSGGMAFIGPREESDSAHRRNLPRASFGDDFDEHNVDADTRLSLAAHLADVADETRRLTQAVQLNDDLSAALVAAAERHDLGKSDPRFQAMLLNSSPDLAHMQPKLWAKSATGPSVRQGAGEAFCHSLPKGFRHEMLSVQLAERIECNLDDLQRDVMLHAIAAHHGHARPLAPVVIDDSPYSVPLAKLNPAVTTALSLSKVERLQLPPAHQIDSGIAARFWKLNRRFGWWGLAWLETSLRLSDWVASADPKHDLSPITLSAPCTPKQPLYHELSCPGLDATNPLGFLSSLGLLRTLTSSLPNHDVRMKWQHSGVWHPVLVTRTPITADEIVEVLQSALHGQATSPHFTELGQNTTVPYDEFRKKIQAALTEATAASRTTIDFYAAFGCDGLVSENDGVTIQDTALRTMAGAGHQHFLETMKNVINACEVEHLHKTIFETWQYDDPTQTLSLRFDPLDDNRYALRWRNPSGDPDRKKIGSMLGANRLAIEAIPLLTTAPGPRYLQTIGFKGHRSRDTFFSWPVWTAAINIDTVRSVLALSEVQSNTFDQQLSHRGIACVFRSQRITVGKVRNFSPASIPQSATSK